MKKNGINNLTPLSIDEIMESQEIVNCNDFFADIITQLLKEEVTDGDTIATSLCMLAHDILVAQHMTSYEIEQFVDEIFPRSGFKFHLHD